MSDRQITNQSQGLKERLSSSSFIDRESKPIQFSYQVTVKAQVKKQTKTILHQQRGIIPAHSFTAILGPSGSGKTTFLNFLSGRLMSDNISIEGSYKINGNSIKSIEPYSNQIGYVMQEDALLGTLTPKQCFQFAADLRLDISNFRKSERVEQLLQQLGLTDCADVRIGNTFIKGVSGGQRKRTSIGIQLITNPNAIFLDEPTTGLDSTTALQVILLLSDLAKKGKTIISTIHQPSSQLFCEFDRLMLLVDGRCIFSGKADDSYTHFSSMGYTCPELMNASEFYLDLMSLKGEQAQQQYEQQKLKHNNQILEMEKAYNESKYSNMFEDQSLSPVQKEPKRNISFFYEFFLIVFRSLICQIRNPMDVGLKIVQSVFTAVIVIVVFGQIDNDNYQNLRGVCFFMVSQNAFGGIQGTLATFSLERPVFIRQRFSKSYSTISYFLARTGCTFPFQLIYPTVGAAIVYWVTGMGVENWTEFWKVILVVNCTYFLSSSYGLLYSTLIPKLETAMALVPVLIIPFMLLGGFFINLNDVDDIRVIFFPIMYLSPFKYGFQGLMLALGNKFGEKFTPESFQMNIYIMLAIGVGTRIVSLIAMQIVSSPKRPKIKKAQ